MSDEPSALHLQHPAPTDADYDAIHNAVMETWRGRWFLSEYAIRNRNADTTLLLTAIERIENALRLRESGEPAIADHEKRDAEQTQSLATDSTQAIPQTMREAIGQIRAAISRLQDMAVSLREMSGDAGGGALQARIAEIMQACTALDNARADTQDMADRLAGLLAASERQRHDDLAPETEIPVTLPSNVSVAATSTFSETPAWLSVLAPPLTILSEMYFTEEARATPAEPAVEEIRPELIVPSDQTSPATNAGTASSGGGSAASLPASGECIAAKPPEMDRNLPRDPLAPIRALSEEEKIALFG